MYIDSRKEYSLPTYGFGITRDLLDELGHANYNALKKHLETARHRLCKHLGFGRKNLRKHLNLGLFMVGDSYEYLLPLRENDYVATIHEISIEGKTKLHIELRLVRLSSEAKGGEGFEMRLTNVAHYHMVMVNLKNGRPVRIPSSIVRSIELFQREQSEIMNGHAPTR